MKNTILSLLCAGIVFPVSAAFIQEGPTIMDIIDVKDLADDTPVVIQGNIIQKIDKDKYLFRDNTDEIIVEINDKAWNKVDVRTEDTVQLVGETDKDFSETKIEVDQVIKVK